MNRRKFVITLPAALLLSAQAAQASPARLGIIFVAHSTCPYCAAISPILNELQTQGGVEVLVASMDRTAIYPFPNFEDGLTHPLTAHYASVPLVLIFNGRLGRVTHEVGGVRNMRRFILRLSTALRQSSAL
jgi:hypothetical protein